MKLEKVFLTYNDVRNLATALWNKMRAGKDALWHPWVHGIPRGGVPASYAVLLASYHGFTIDDSPNQAAIFIDDIIDSGATKARYAEKYPDTPFYALIDKTDPDSPYKDKWVVFPWERKEGDEEPETVEDNVTRILQYIGEDTTRQGLLETPKRVVKAWKEWCAGYGQDVKDHFKAFEDGAEGCDEMVIVKDIPFYSHCEHHMAPFFGTVSVAYLPDGKVLGLSKFSRIVETFARRLQVQERLTTQIAESIMEHLQPKGVGVVVKARHMCIESRGVCKHNSETYTQKLCGVFKEAHVKSEFLLAVK